MTYGRGRIERDEEEKNVQEEKLKWEERGFLKSVIGKFGDRRILERKILFRRKERVAKDKELAGKRRSWVRERDWRRCIIREWNRES